MRLALLRNLSKIHIPLTSFQPFTDSRRFFSIALEQAPSCKRQPLLLRTSRLLQARRCGYPDLVRRNRLA